MTTIESPATSSLLGRKEVSDCEMVSSCSRQWLSDSAVDSKNANAAAASNSKISDFSIEYILSPFGPGATRVGSWSVPSGCCEEEDQEEEEDAFDDEDDDCRPKFNWLQCTRYHPPKLQRARRKEGNRRRKLGRNPRIPFSGTQVAVLEDRFRLGHYLSSSEVQRLSALLCLSETRVKIWFQNRRARERRERDTMIETNKHDDNGNNWFCGAVVGKTSSGPPVEEAARNEFSLTGDPLPPPGNPETTTTMIIASSENNSKGVIPIVEDHKKRVNTLMNAAAGVSKEALVTVSISSSRSAFSPFNPTHQFFYHSKSYKDRGK